MKRVASGVAVGACTVGLIAAIYAAYIGHSTDRVLTAADIDSLSTPEPDAGTPPDRVERIAVFVSGTLYACREYRFWVRSSGAVAAADVLPSVIEGAIPSDDDHVAIDGTCDEALSNRVPFAACRDAVLDIALTVTDERTVRDQPLGDLDIRGSVTSLYYSTATLQSDRAMQSCMLQDGKWHELDLATDGTRGF